MRRADKGKGTDKSKRGHKGTGSAKPRPNPRVKRSHDPKHLPLTAAFRDMGNADESAVRADALQLMPQYVSGEVEEVTFEGCFTPRSDTMQVAIHSDDGSDVYVDGHLVINRRGQPQGLGDLDNSFFVLPVTWQKDLPYRMKIVYTNVIHLGSGDEDGCTLYAYAGGGTATGYFGPHSVKLTSSSPHHLIYRRLAAPLGPPNDEPVIAEDYDPEALDPGIIGGDPPDEEDENDSEGEVPSGSGSEPSQPSITIDPGPTSPVITYNVSTVG